MFILTRKIDDIDSGTFATLDGDGNAMIQMFIDKDDAITYNVQLEAVDQPLHVTEVEIESLEKLCTVLGYAYCIIEPGDFVIPKMETLLASLHNDRLQDTDV